MCRCVLWFTVIILALTLCFCLLCFLVVMVTLSGRAMRLIYSCVRIGSVLSFLQWPVTDWLCPPQQVGGTSVAVSHRGCGQRTWGRHLFSLAVPRCVQSDRRHNTVRLDSRLQQITKSIRHIMRREQVHLSSPLPRCSLCQPEDVLWQRGSWEDSSVRQRTQKTRRSGWASLWDSASKSGSGSVSSLTVQVLPSS